MNVREDLLAAGLVVVGLAGLTGCGVDYARVNRELRERNLALEEQTAKQAEQVRNQQATIERLNAQVDQKVPRAVTLPEARLKQLFTVGKVEILGQTDAWDWTDDSQPDGFRVFVRPRMENGDVLPATGTLTVEAFDLAAEKGAEKLGEWTFSAEQLKDKWYGTLGTNYLAVNCPWTKPPAHREITFKVKFVEALTERVFTDQKVVQGHW